jgi:lipopolysaccharide/colanic/teichoic acid biosynthesis glycosyltransferase
MPMSLSTAGEATAPTHEPDQVTALATAELAVLPSAELAEAARSSTRELLNNAAIRAFDVVVALLLLAVLLPLMVLVAIAVCVDSAGPAFFRCERVGHRGQRLRMLKIRKMCHHARGPALTTEEDCRFTRIGGLLTRLRIDEIPQLVHVLRGSMSLVGPRPEAPEFVDLHPRDYQEILEVPPGITGLSQLAFCDERRILDPERPVEDYVSRLLPAKVALDKLYADKRSLAFNLRVLYWTVAAVICRRPIAVHRDSGKMNIRRR